MSIPEIIEEEFEACRSLINKRVAAFLMGGNWQRPRLERADGTRVEARSSSSSSRPVGRPPGGSTRSLRSASEESDRRIFTFLAENPGSYGSDIIEGLGFPNGQDSMYSNGMNRMKNGGLIMARGKGRQTTWYVTQDEFEPHMRSKKPLTSRPVNAPAVIPNEERRKALWDYFSVHPGKTMTQFRDEMGINVNFMKSYSNSLSEMKMERLLLKKGKYMNTTYSAKGMYRPAKGPKRAKARAQSMSAPERDAKIVAFCVANPGALIGDIVEDIGQARGVINSAMYRLVRRGQLEKQKTKDDRTTFWPK